jgi:yecA family protein
MTAALRAEATASVADIIRDLEQARSRPDAALRAAVGHASEIAPAVIELLEKAATGVDLLEHQANLLFWGIHALGAARRTELYRPLMRLVSECPAGVLDPLLGAAQTETLGRIIISVFDGNPAPLLDACADREVDGYARWELIGALARLTFDGAIARETMLEFLDRFEREPLAEPDDDAWQGWQDAISLLGLEEMRERLGAACREGRFLQTGDELQFCLEQLTLARSLAPGDAGLFVRANLIPLGDPVEALDWLGDGSDDTSEDEDDPFGDDPFASDPAGSIALNQEEIDWLAAFLASERLPDDAMSVEQIDGYFCALAMDSNRTRARECAGAIFGSTGETSIFENDKQSAKVGGLIVRIWDMIVERLNADYAHRPLLQASDAPKAQLWAKGFIEGVQAADSQWAHTIENGDGDDFVMFLGSILQLKLDDGEEVDGIRMTPEMRAECVALLPPSILGLHAAVRLHEQMTQDRQPVRSTKVGRNAPCPCGSGKKFKRCCGSAERLALN